MKRGCSRKFQISVYKKPTTNRNHQYDPKNHTIQQLSKRDRRRWQPMGKSSPEFVRRCDFETGVCQPPASLSGRTLNGPRGAGRVSEHQRLDSRRTCPRVSWREAFASTDAQSRWQKRLRYRVPMAAEESTGGSFFENGPSRLQVIGRSVQHLLDP